MCIVQGPTFASVSGVRVAADDVEALLAEVRGRVPADRHTAWWIGPSAQPPDLYERLLALGLADPVDGVSEVRALTLTHEPPCLEGVHVARIVSFDEYRDAAELRWDAFATPEVRRAKSRGRLREDFEESQRFGLPVAFLATVEGRPAGVGIALPSDRGVFLVSGATAEWARGRGVYRALVRARWDYAVSRGTPALVTGAVADTSYPILLRLGFEEVATIRRLEDPRG